MKANAPLPLAERLDAMRSNGPVNGKGWRSSTSGTPPAPALVALPRTPAVPPYDGVAAANAPDVLVARARGLAMHDDLAPPRVAP